MNRVNFKIIRKKEYVNRVNCESKYDKKRKKQHSNHNLAYLWLAFDKNPENSLREQILLSTNKFDHFKFVPFFDQYGQLLQSARNAYGNTVLIEYLLSANRVHPGVIRNIIHFDQYSIDSIDRNGWTPLLLAVSTRAKKEVFDILINEGKANVNITNQIGFNVINALASFNRVDRDIIASVIRAGFHLD